MLFVTLRSDLDGLIITVQLFSEVNLLFFSSYDKNQQDALFLNIFLVKNSTCFELTYCPSSGELILYSQQLVFVILVMLTVC